MLLFSSLLADGICFAAEDLDVVFFEMSALEMVAQSVIFGKKVRAAVSQGRRRVQFPKVTPYSPNPQNSKIYGICWYLLPTI